MKINFFKDTSPLYPLRWLLIFSISIAMLLAYANLSGWRILSFSGQQQWNASGPGYHK
ncbi:MAG TPA: hypothetical protein VM935_14270 [Chitinophagaceae bacterium]|jgi:hypothetical protein|nr:hypothetical protein [Chitinophagaceae bacterium]